MRKLLYFPVIHHQADLGSLETRISLDREIKYCKEDWQEHCAQVQISWNRIEKEVKQQVNIIPSHKVRIYQDGLPEAGEIGLKIVKETARQGSRNYQIVWDLLRQGAQLEEAESKELLLQEYGYLSGFNKAATLTKKLKAYLMYQEVARELLNKRDSYIANMINVTLKKEELGIAFFGGKHSIVDRLHEDIAITIIQMFKDKISADLMNQ